MRRLVKRVFRCVGYGVYRLDRADVGTIARPVENMQIFLEHLRAELDVPNCCSRLLEQGAIRYIQFEVSQTMIKGMGRDGSEIFKLLSDFGYKCHPISESGDLLPPVTITDAFFANFIAVPGWEQ